MTNPLTFRPDEDNVPRLAELEKRYRNRTAAVNAAIELLYRHDCATPTVVHRMAIDTSVCCLACSAQAEWLVFYTDNSFSWRCSQHANEA